VQFARALHVTGLMNAQYDIQGGWAPPADRAFSITNRNTVKRLLPENVNDHGKPSVVEVGKRLVDLIDRVAGRVLENQRAAQRERLTVDLKGMVAGGVVDPQVAAQRHQLLVQNEGLAG